VQVGLRGTLWDGHDWDNAIAHGMRVIPMDDYEAMGREAVVAEIKRVVGEGPTYITFDMDGLDPADAPGTAVPEPGGIRMRDALMILRSLTGLDIVGGDVVEISPPHDPTGMTALNAANVMFELLCLVATAFDKSRTR
jgi:guanidinopropionase